MSRSGDRQSIRVGAAQFDAVAGDIAANIAAHERLIDDAGTRGVDVLVFPELSLTGYASTLLDETPARCVIDPAGPDLAPIEDACRANRIVAVVGACRRGWAGARRHRRRSAGPGLRNLRQAAPRRPRKGLVRPGRYGMPDRGRWLAAGAGHLL